VPDQIPACQLEPRKGNFSLDDHGWTLRALTDLEEWDCLTRWFLEYTARPEVALSATLRRERGLLQRVLAEHR
jgi:hypothetical protein